MKKLFALAAAALILLTACASKTEAEKEGTEPADVTVTAALTEEQTDPVATEDEAPLEDWAVSAETLPEGGTFPDPAEDYEPPETAATTASDNEKVYDAAGNLLIDTNLDNLYEGDDITFTVDTSELSEKYVVGVFTNNTGKTITMHNPLYSFLVKGEDGKWKYVDFEDLVINSADVLETLYDSASHTDKAYIAGELPAGEYCLRLKFTLDDAEYLALSEPFVIE